MAIARSKLFRRPQSGLFQACNIGVTCAGHLMENIAQPSRDLGFCQLIWNDDVVETGELSFRQIGTKYLPVILNPFDSDMPSEYVVNQQFLSSWSPMFLPSS